MDDRAKASGTVREEAIFFDAQGERLPTAKGAVRGEILEHLADGTVRSTLVTFDGDEESRLPA